MKHTKRIVAILSTAILAISAIPFSASALGGQALYHDVNSDSRINILDVTKIQTYLADIIDLTDNQKQCADVNSDGKITVEDVSQLQKNLAKDGTAVVNIRFENGMPIMWTPLRLTDSKGNVIQKWKSTNIDYAVSGLDEYETYTLSVDGDFNVLGTQGAYPVSFRLNDSSKVILTVKYTQTQISVVDSLTGEMLSGAKYKIVASDNGLIDSLVSNKDTTILKGLSNGHTYRIVPEKAPEGYEFAEVEVVADNSKKEDRETDGTFTVCKTGDDTILKIKYLPITE